MARHVLAVWNPEMQPETIEVHVERLRRGPAAHVWWGRIYRGDPSRKSKARVSLGPLEELDVDAVAGRLVLFVTDFTSLHALRIDRVQEAPAAGDEGLPAYLRDHTLLHAFRATDLRAVSHDRLTTLGWLRENLGLRRLGENAGLDPQKYRVDPYASLSWAWPVEVEGPELERVFPLAGPPVGSRWVDLPETLHPPRLAAALQRLERAHGEVWRGLEADSRMFLATAEVVRQETREAGFDPSPCLVGIARALERELRDEVWLPLLRAGRAGHPGAPDLCGAHAVLDRDLGADPAKTLTLGAMPIVGQRLAAWLAEHDGLSALAAPVLRDWLGAFAQQRNHASHGRLIDAAACLAQVEGVLGGSAPRVLAAVVGAKRAVRGRLGLVG
jgi:hypothetical protein